MDRLETALGAVRLYKNKSKFITAHQNLYKLEK
jgi:hypothetical protein